jgi:hypothetical protein
MGVLLFISATQKTLRKTTIIFAIAEKTYMVGFALYSFAVHAPYAMNYIIPLTGDSFMVLGGIWYLIKRKKLKRE